jgi:hypothetical protein
VELDCIYMLLMDPSYNGALMQVSRHTVPGALASYGTLSVGAHYGIFCN